ncbi:MAG: CPBP family intramembrane metalloprotease [Oscillospiraceae bacterium]|nr:CPBP family intramembrane metalloprotease [Oscillospiraceae bacterium]
MREERVFIGPSRREWIFGLAYLFAHVFFLQSMILEILFLLISAFDIVVTDVLFNIIWFAIAFVVLVIFLWSYLRAGFARFLEYGLSNLTTLLAGYGIYLALAFLLNRILFSILPELPSPNNDVVMEMAVLEFWPMFAVAVLLAPVVEEIFFRGVMFAPLRNVSRLLAYAVSSLAFGLWHVIQFLIFDFSPLLFVTALIYVPAGIALAWVYERSGSIWTPIALHAFINAVVFALMR